MWSRVRRLIAVALCVAALAPVGAAATPALAQAFPPSSPCSVAPTTGAVQGPSVESPGGPCDVKYDLGQGAVANVTVAAFVEVQANLDPATAWPNCNNFSATQPIDWKAVASVGAPGYRGQCPAPKVDTGATFANGLAPTPNPNAVVVVYLFQRGMCLVSSYAPSPGEQKLVAILKQIDQAIQAAPAGNVCAGPTPTRAEVRVFSTPKQRADYRFEVAIPAMVPDRQGAPTFDQLYDQKLGKLELRLTYQAGKDGPTKQVSFSWPMAALVATSDQDRERLALDGQTYFVDRTRLLVLWRTLDQLEPLAADPANALDTPAPGEARFRGGELLFKRELYLSDDKGPVAHSDPNNSLFLRYVVRYPVVFLPGTAGSVLTVNGSRVWPANGLGSISPDERQFWGQLALDAQGNALPGLAVAATDVFRSYGTMLACNDKVRKGCVYQRWLAHMAQQGYAEGRNLLLFPYDWRLRIDGHSDALDQVVQRARDLNYDRGAIDWPQSGAPRPNQALPRDQVILVGHSQGGLVIRAYVARDDRAAKVAQAIMLGVPNLGTLKPFRLLGAYGYSFEAPFLDPEMGKWMGRNLPAAYYQLEVTPTGAIQSFLFDAQGNPVPDVRAALAALRTHVFCQAVQSHILSPPTTWGCQEATLNMDLLDAGTRFHAGLPSPADKGIPTFSINSVDRMTPIAYRQATRDVEARSPHVGSDFSGTIPHDVLATYGFLPADVFAQDAYPIVTGNPLGSIVRLPYYQEVQAACGDNLVPLYSLEGLPGAQNIYVAGVEHGGYLDDDSVQALIDRLLQGVRPASPRGKPTCNSLPVPSTNGTIVSVTSPADLHVYDAQGRHTGLTPQASVEEGIPGSTFEQDGPTQRVALPPSAGAFRVELRGTQDGSASLTVVAGDGRSERRADYLGIPETKAMRASLQLAPGALGPGTTLSVDPQGDGKNVQTLKPESAGGGLGASAPPAAPTTPSGSTSVSASVAPPAGNGAPGAQSPPPPPALGAPASTSDEPSVGLPRDAAPAPTQTSPGTGGAGRLSFPRPNIVAWVLVRTFLRRFGAIAIAIVAGALLVIPLVALRASHRGPRPGSGPVHPNPGGGASATQRRGHFCTRCGASAPDNARFCTRCGHAL